ncbi:MAG: undecaprenyl-phosphate glucose phosphotransferase [Caldilineaceae bacterium]|nr:undecaprenyl-phosphate glucose phosphotransferase [Caldilineaceae bacterium]
MQQKTMATADSINLPDSGIERSQRKSINKPSRLVRWIGQANPSIWTPLLFLTDMALIVAAFGAAYLIRYRLQWFRSVEPSFNVAFEEYGRFLIALLIILPITYYLSDVYPYRRDRSWIEQVYDIATATTLGVMVVIIVSLFFNTSLYSRLIFLYAAFLITLLLGISRLLIQQTLAHLSRYGIGVEKLLLVGAGDVGRMVLRNITARPDYGYQVVGFVDDNPVKSGTDIGPFKALGPIENFDELVRHHAIDSVVICLPWQSHRMIQRLLRTCDQYDVRALVVPDLFQLTKNQMQVEDLNGIPLISSREVSIQGTNFVVKRAADLLVSGLAAFLLSPLFLAIAVAIRLDSPGPIFFVQKRIGRNGEPFRCYKFRSMIQDADHMRAEMTDLNEATGPLFKVREDPRRTRVGRFLRRYSLDELPQLFNVILGDMSLIGPRPNLPEEVAAYQEWHKKRLSVNPGITGLWQVSGRSELTFDEMVLLDIYYVENWTLFMDIKIFLRSIPAVLRGRGAY